MQPRITIRHQLLFTSLLVVAFLFTSLGISEGRVYAQDNSTDSSAEEETVSPTQSSVEETTRVFSDYYTEKYLTLLDGTDITESIINGPSEPPAGLVEEQIDVFPETAKTLADVPAFSWVYGCSAVSGAMIAGYYDRMGYSNMYTGPANGGVMPLVDTSWPKWSDGSTAYPNNPLVASHKGVDGRTTRGSIDDYWVRNNSTAQDPFITGGWTQHTWGSAIGDYMKTSQSKYNPDGGTRFVNLTNSPNKLTCSAMVTMGVSAKDGTYGRKLFYEARGYTVTDCFNQKTDNNAGGFTFADFKAQIDAGNPVLINLKGHTVVGVGYNTIGNKVYIHTTWGNYTTSMTWGGSYADMAMDSVSIVNLATITPKVVSPKAIISDTTPTYKWSMVPGASKYQLQTYSGSTVITDIVVTSSSCSGSTCATTPAKVLPLAAYKWRVRALRGSTWSAYSPYTSFTVAKLAGNFSSTFTTDATGWTPVTGTWRVSGGNYIGDGPLFNNSSTAHSGIYSTLDYTVVMKDSNKVLGGGGLFFRGVPSPLGEDDIWHDGYMFVYGNSMNFYVDKIVNGVQKSVVPLTATSYVNPGGWNTLRVTASGSTLKFYINGHLVASKTDTSRLSGQVGIVYYKNSTSTLYVDSASLLTTIKP